MNMHRHSANENWQALFVPGKERRKAVVIYKHYHPLLVISGRQGKWNDFLSLYPAQTAFAKAARYLLGLGLRWNIPLPLQCQEISFDPSDNLWRFLSAQVGGNPDFAILCGNPRALGRRFTLLISNGSTQRIIKAGLSDEAKALIASEEHFLRNQKTSAHIPTVLDSIKTERWSAFSTPYFVGKSPSQGSLNEATRVLESWIEPGEISLGAVPAWKRLMENPHSNRIPLLEKLSTKMVGRSIFHGDFAPWNIKATPQGWVVLDWENGESLGVPGWDLYHFAIQSRILVQQMPHQRVLRAVEEMIDSDIFRSYAGKIKIEGIERLLALAYMEYMLHVKPAGESTSQLTTLYQTALANWL